MVRSGFDLIVYPANALAELARGARSRYAKVRDSGGGPALTCMVTWLLRTLQEAGTRQPARALPGGPVLEGPGLRTRAVTPDLEEGMILAGK